MATIDAFSSASNLLAALRQRQISASELLEHYQKRIASYNPQLNAIVIPNEEQARQQASAADEAYAHGESSLALQGLPLTFKECIEVAGLRATSGLPQTAQYVSTQTGPVAQRILAAGAVLMGKTNVPPHMSDWQADNLIFGRTNNPWDLTRTPGGSSGGSSAALAAGLSALELGTDIAGSIRIPAAFCGLYGHRPSDTAVPRYGRKPGIPLPNPALVLGVQGPLARSASDLQLALDVMAGPIIGEDVAWQLNLPPARHSTLRDFRVAVLPAAAWLPVDDELSSALDDLANRLRQLGATVQEVQPEGFELRKYTEGYLNMLSIFMYADLNEEERSALISAMQHGPNPLAPAQIAGLRASAAQLIALHALREQYRDMFRSFFKDWDILLSPATIVPAFEHQDIDSATPSRTLKVNGKPTPYEFLAIHPGIASFIGHPATAFPWGRTRQGLPLGLQAIGPYLEDRSSIAFAGLLEQEFGGFVAPAGYVE
ncbi:amidase family protein [Ktedonosporobacter rubrisoli]|nr:amidase family protein [Ktedonosporobacter rubrisoli]